MTGDLARLWRILAGYGGSRGLRHLTSSSNPTLNPASSFPFPKSTTTQCMCPEYCVHGWAYHFCTDILRGARHRERGAGQRGCVRGPAHACPWVGSSLLSSGVFGIKRARFRIRMSSSWPSIASQSTKPGLLKSQPEVHPLACPPNITCLAAWFAWPVVGPVPGCPSAWPACSAACLADCLCRPPGRGPGWLPGRPLLELGALDPDTDLVFVAALRGGGGEIRGKTMGTPQPESLPTGSADEAP